MNSRLFDRLLVFLMFALLIVGFPLLPFLGNEEAINELLKWPIRTEGPGGVTASFQWEAFVLMSVGILVVLWPFVERWVRRREDKTYEPEHPPYELFFPTWGYLSLILCGVAWVIAWVPGFWTPYLAKFMFFPLWIGFIGTVNAMTWVRKGHSLMTSRPRYFTLLFVVSSLFWWLFEWLNLFSHNWYYLGTRTFGDTLYVLHATLAFSTVLPAVMSMKELLETSRSFHDAYGKWKGWKIPASKMIAIEVIWLSGLVLLCIGLFPVYLYPAVWLAPLGLLVGLKFLLGHRGELDDLAAGRWTSIVSAALAALICGFFWEMWNEGSSPRWVYQIPLVDAWKVFEMPVLGYAGYLPFGVLCYSVCRLLEGPRIETSQNI